MTSTYLDLNRPYYPAWLTTLIGMILCIVLTRLQVTPKWFA